jgi:hypothetical protein
MKKILVSLRFDTPYGNYLYTGIVIAKIIDEKAVVSPDKIFSTAFGFPLPNRSTIHY